MSDTMSIVRFQVVSYRKPEQERVTFDDHGGEWDFFDSLNDAVQAIQDFSRRGRHPEGDQWAVSGLDCNDCCVEVFDVDVDKGD
jgi:hypothetical protein